MVDQPGVPRVIHSLLSFSTSVGVIELSILFCGAIALASPPIRPNQFGVPGFALKSSISLFKKNPSFLLYSFEPKEAFRVVVTAMALP